jgi:ribonucleoside-diphosphate reductase beta chain
MSVSIFEHQSARKPDHFPWAQEFIDALLAGFWTPQKFSFKGDAAQFEYELSEDLKFVTVRTLSAIGQIEIAVKKFWSTVGDKLPHPSITDLGLVLGFTEVIHNQAYEKLLEVLDLNDVFEENLKDPVIAGRVQYLRKYAERVYKDDERKQFLYSIILFTLFVENVSLFSQFYVILWINRNLGLLKDTAQQVEYTRNEEALHAQAGIKIINTIREQHPELFDEGLRTRVIEEIVAAIEAEDKVIEWIIGDVNYDGLSKEVLQGYIRLRMNESLDAINMGYVKFDVSDDVRSKVVWMDEELYGSNLTDFFHKHPVEYSKNNRAFDKEDLF